MIFVLFNSNSTGVTSGACIASPSRAAEFTSGYDGVRVAQSLVLYIVLCI